jgi:hypothetical protein
MLAGGTKALEWAGEITKAEMALRPAGAPELTSNELAEAMALSAKKRGLTQDAAMKQVHELTLASKAVGTKGPIDESAFYRALTRDDRKKAARERAAAMAPKGRTDQKFDFRNSRFDIKQDFAQGFDPDRVAVAFQQDLGRAGEMKMQSSYTPLFGTR